MANLQIKQLSAIKTIAEKLKGLREVRDKEKKEFDKTYSHLSTIRG